MAKFIELDPKKVDELRSGARSRAGSIAYPILQEFIETGLFMVQLDHEAMGRKPNSISSTLNTYAKNHQMEVQVFQRKGKVYMMRLDVDAQGNPIPDWKEEAYGDDEEDS